MSDRWKPHVTVAALVARPRPGRPVDDPATAFLLVEEDTLEGPRLNNPAGHLELGESPLEAVVREALEETACVFSPECLVGVYMSRHLRPRQQLDITYLRLAFGGTVSEPDPRLRLDTGIRRTLWMTLDELRACRPQHRSALVLRSLEDMVAGQRLPLSAVSIDRSLYEPEIKGPP
ncbi:MAG: NUDIX hydrolase [Pseudomonadota bacterium]